MTPSKDASSSTHSRDSIVFLNVYDLSEQNDIMYWCGCGIYHTGVEVYEQEYAYGGHDYDVSGIFSTEPGMPSEPLALRKRIEFGPSRVPRAGLKPLLRQMGEEYKGSSYHLLQKNCNHFTNDLCQSLVAKGAPTWVNRLARIAVLCHCLLPTSWVPPLITPSQSPDEGDDVEAPERAEHATLFNAPRSDLYPQIDSSTDESCEPIIREDNVASHDPAWRIVDMRQDS